MSLRKMLSKAKNSLLPSKAEKETSYPFTPQYSSFEWHPQQLYDTYKHQPPIGDFHKRSEPTRTGVYPPGHRRTPAGTSGSSLQAGTSAFANAHNFTIGNAYMIDNHRTQEERRNEAEYRARKALQALASRGMTSAMLNSKERSYPPRCDPDTRQRLRSRIVKWGRDENASKQLLWLSGPAGVGKSAVAQTVAEEFKEAGLLGGAFFFSRPNSRGNPDTVIPTLAYQLARHIPEYRSLVTQLLSKDPVILDSDRRTQFQELIVNPFNILMTHDPNFAQQPRLIFLDGLDECDDRGAQREFVEMIVEHARPADGLPFRWMISSRPEPHLKIAFSTTQCQQVCIQETLEIEDDEAQDDAQRMLLSGFAEIRGNFPDQLPMDWPSSDDLDRIAAAALGHLGFVSFLLRFIGDENYGDPANQLAVCLQYLVDTNALSGALPNARHPLHALDLLYTQILLDILPGDLATAYRILGLSVLYANWRPVLVQANFLGLDQASFYRSLQRLHSVLFIPSATEATTRSIQVYHASFSDYLKDPNRSGRFVMDEGALHLDIATQGLRWLRHWSKSPSGPQGLPKLNWIINPTESRTLLHSVCNLAFGTCWKAALGVTKDSVRPLIESLEEFDFDLHYSQWEEDHTADFAYFIQWLLDAGRKNIATLESYTEGAGDAAETDGVIKVWYRARSAYKFVSAFLGDVKEAEDYSIHLRLGKLNPTHIYLIVCEFGVSGFSMPA